LSEFVGASGGLRGRAGGRYRGIEGISATIRRKLFVSELELNALRADLSRLSGKRVIYW
jgi:hypothetical protein